MGRSAEKSDGAFRTIREVADWLGVPTHVLRFWESKFDQIAPVKGAGGRRYYRPDDMRLLGGIKVMLHDQGLTIRGVQQKIDDEGTEALMDLSPRLEMPDGPPARTRKVIRNDAPPADTPAKADPAPAAPPPEPLADMPDAAEAPAPDGNPEGGPEGGIDATGDAPPDTADPVTAAPEGAPSPAPAPVPKPDPVAAPPVDPTPVAAPHADPAPKTAAPAEPSPVQAPAAPMPTPVPPAPQPTPTAHPLAQALRLAKAARGIKPDGKLRLRRVIRRYKALGDEIQDDLDSAP
ncbi:MAG: MerR family transcriptional regulator [Pseudomonadota bacterium]